MKRMRPTADKHTRVLQPGRDYQPPQPQQKLPPLDNGEPDYYAQLAQSLHSEELLTKRLIASIAGISPTLAREVAWRATGSIKTPAQEASPIAVASALQELWAPLTTGEWRPGTIHHGKTLVGFSAYKAQQTNSDGQDMWMPTALMSQAIEKFSEQKQKATGSKDTEYKGTRTQETAKTNNLDEYAVLRKTVQSDIDSARKRLKRQLKALASDAPKPGEPEELRMKAEWLLALNSQIKSGQKSLDVDLGDQMLQIPLDPQKSAIAQAEQMFKRASKLERAALFIPKRSAVIENDLTFLDQLSGDLALAENQPELIAVREELSRARLLPIGRGKQQKPQQRADRSASQPLRFVSPNGLAILVGRNARQNDKVTFDLAKAEDLWLHARGTPGAHVVIRSGGQEVGDETLRAAAQLAAYYSRQRGELAAEVAYTTRKHVTRVPGGRPGQVFVRNEKTVLVLGELPEEAVVSQ